MAKKLTYPFVPKSTASLEPGHFWSVPLDNENFACGRVIQMRSKDGRRDSRLFLAGLMDWCGPLPPTSESIAGCRVLQQGEVHIRTIPWNRGEVLGFRDLSLDGIEPQLFKDAVVATHVQRGCEVIRKFDPKTDKDLSVISVWGLAVIKVRAEFHFGRRR